MRSQTETPKRYRYTGKERDEETGFSYHGARYCAPWLGRWVSCDPIGIKGGINLYQYAKDTPVNLSDPTGNEPISITHVQGDYGQVDRPLLDFDNWTVKSVNIQKIKSSPDYIDNAVRNINTGSYDPWSLTISSFRLTLTDKTSFNVQASQLDYSGTNIATSYIKFEGITYPVDAAGHITYNIIDTQKILKGAAAWEVNIAQVAFEANNTRLRYAYTVNAFAKSITLLGGYASQIPGLSGLFSSVAGRIFSSRPTQKALPPAPEPRAPQLPGPTVDPKTGEPVGQFVVDPKGNTLIQPKGGATVGNPAGTFVELGFPTDRLPNSYTGLIISILIRMGTASYRGPELTSAAQALTRKVTSCRLIRKRHTGP